jgi:(E)-4-hydroxy-3-methylbut-2-enyl-diphosphate synthase
MDPYCCSISRTIRRKTCEVKVGSVKIGGANPIRIQSMTTSDTRDIQATVEQIVRLADAGCEIARVTVQGKKEAEACEGIKNCLLQRGYSIPLVADIHFYPPAALMAAEFVDKIRINPGNYADRRAQFKKREYDDSSYAHELEKVAEAFVPLVKKCKQRGIALRIGTNHGSLSDRIMNRYGDTPRGMVESALEFARICRQFDYHNFLFSMKSSNPLVMIQAYRLLCAEMFRLGWDYPLHLGVTEAGAGEDGRIKSAMGIGALLLDGIGDTIRVSLTEDPWNEIEPCRQIIEYCNQRTGQGIASFEERRREERRLVRAPLHRDGAVVAVQRDLCDREPDLFWSGQESALFFQPETSPLHETRALIEDLKNRAIDLPVVLALTDQRLIPLAIEAGAILCDRLVEGLCLTRAPVSWSFSFLQAARMRMTRADFISCPGCGRTLFDLQEVSRRIREQTSHLVGIKIAIMGCIVNGPGEMADADFGYVGSKPGKIDLYVGKTCVERDIPYADADRKLIELIKAHGRWSDAAISNF